MGQRLKGYRTHSSNSSEINIRCIDNGFIVEYREYMTQKELFVSTLEDLNEFLTKYYIEKD